ncbi:hypothetical protein LINPERHAP1_LOCUS37676, partial [Linum perenne]
MESLPGFVLCRCRWSRLAVGLSWRSDWGFQLIASSNNRIRGFFFSLLARRIDYRRRVARPLLGLFLDDLFSPLCVGWSTRSPGFDWLGHLFGGSVWFNLGERVVIQFGGCIHSVLISKLLELFGICYQHKLLLFPFIYLFKLQFSSQ